MLRVFLRKHPRLKSIVLFIWNFPNFIKFYIFFPIKGFFRVVYSFVNKKYMKDLRNLKNVYLGKKCFIVATGPSLTTRDLDKLSENNIITFGVNSIYKIYEQVSWRPDFYICGDLEQMQDNLAKSGKFFFEDKAKKKSFTDISLISQKLSGDVIYLPINRQLHGMKTFLDDHFKFSMNPIYSCYDYYTVTALSMLLAMYMGFKEIYLLGCDCNYMGKLRHANGMVLKGDIEYSDDYFLYNAAQQTKGYTFINRVLLKHGVITYNATRGGALEVFPRVNFDEVIGNNHDCNIQ